MVTLVEALQLLGYAAGALGGSLLFMEFFQVPSYVNYEPEYDDYNIDMAPNQIRQYTWAGRAGAILVAAGFAVQFLAVLLAP
jgi:hypothetical protein